MLTIDNGDDRNECFLVQALQYSFTPTTACVSHEDCHIPLFPCRRSNSSQMPLKPICPIHLIVAVIFEASTAPRYAQMTDVDCRVTECGRQ